MRTEGVDISFRYLESVMDADQVRRVVVRAPEGNIHILQSDTADIEYSVEIEGPSERIEQWACKERRAESIAILDCVPDAFIRISKCIVKVPASIGDVEIHSARGSIELELVKANVLAIIERGDIVVSGARFVEVSSISGSISIDNSEGCSARSMEGSLHCRRISGSIQAEIQRGSVHVDHVLKNVAVVTDEGNIRVRRVAGRIRLISNKGDIELEVAGCFGGGEIQTYSGDISIQLEHSSVEFRAETLSGRIETQHQINSAGMGPKRCAFRTGDGARRLYVKSVLGDIEVN